MILLVLIVLGVYYNTNSYTSRQIRFQSSPAVSTNSVDDEMDVDMTDLSSI